MSSNNFNVNSLAVYVPYSAEVGIGTSNTVNTGSGNQTIGKSLSFLGSTSGSVTLSAPSTGGATSLTLPSTTTGSNLPYSANTVVFNQSGVGSYSPAEFTSVLYSPDGVAPPSLVTNSFFYSCWANTNANGQATANLTNASSNALFNTVIGVSAMAFNKGSNVSSVALTGGYSISTDKKTLIASVVQSTSILLGGSALTTAASNIPVSIVVFGF